ncbi:methylcrotonoyl-CoA carboxylase subunit alpha, mitochondrial isoform X1 [Metopolophium dirhodum]|uniref:methylcrotonoyl-CoA carboxylase subunit alpha, mitochondrial isoform X1 n=2 Tax=Metopolophium dirhodum TaxID=44670 RepID=UPI00298FD283|nr:methylcrotonoyl-CoA carboxylase subunit alpha, mitochondrial isoform X1 [Metopolophium dirhodum]
MHLSVRNIHNGPTKRITKLLIANRGEIACRIIKTARRLQIETVAVYSDVDKDSMHVAMADQAVRVGPAQSAHSYLLKDRIVNAAIKTNSQAIHPGYGFLSENASFAQYCQSNNLIFIGPPPNAIESMGIKSKSKEIMSEAGVPIIEGYHGKDQNSDFLQHEANKIGYPVMIKAIKGGGGKGMKIVSKESEFFENLMSAKRESLSSFGDDSVLIEKYIQQPRHVEVQVFADQHKNCVYLFERDCSIQRRHQKVMEEAPAPRLSEKLRQHLGETAVRAAKAVGYEGAGTVEFIFDNATNMFYFMEMNTRLQVEHPVTEMITGVDLVEWQIKVAEGEQLPLKQNEIKLRGHSVQARIYAEDPYNNFLPAAGNLQYLDYPNVSDDVRVETGVRQGDDVSVHYDPMIAKLVVWSETRSDAFAKLKNNLAAFNIAGLSTNVQFLMSLCAHPELLKGNVHTGFIEQHKNVLLSKNLPNTELISQAVIALILYEENNTISSNINTNDPYSPFATQTGFRVNHNYVQKIKLKHNLCGEMYDVRIEYCGVGSSNSRFNVSFKNKDTEIESNVIGSLDTSSPNRFHLTCIVDGTLYKSNIAFIENSVHLFNKDGKNEFTVVLPFDEKTIDSNEQDTGSNSTILAPTQSTVERVNVSLGDDICIGDPIVVLTAMKMEYVVKAQIEGKIEKILCKEGDSVRKGELLVKIIPIN